MKKCDEIIKFNKKLIYSSTNPQNIHYVEKAQRDVSRTCKGISHYAKEKDEAKEYISKNFTKLLKFNSQKDFDKEHQLLCNDIIGIINNDFTYGKAQKVLNMTLKYYVVDKWDEIQEDEIKFLHSPIDRKILEYLKEIDNNIRSIKVWSKMNCNDYYNLQKVIRKIVKNGECVFMWELKQFNK